MSEAAPDHRRPVVHGDGETLSRGIARGTRTAARERREEPGTARTRRGGRSSRGAGRGTRACRLPRALPRARLRRHRGTWRPPEEMNALREAIHGLSEPVPGADSRVAAFLLGRHPAVDRIATNPKILAFAEVSVGNGLRASQIIGSIMHRSDAESAGVHADQGWLPAPFPEHNCVITFCVPCEGMTAEEGATRVVPGFARGAAAPHPDGDPLGNGPHRGEEGRRGRSGTGPSGTAPACGVSTARAPCSTPPTSGSTRSPSTTTPTCSRTTSTWRPRRKRCGVSWANGCSSGRRSRAAWSTCASSARRRSAPSCDAPGPHARPHGVRSRRPRRPDHPEPARGDELPEPRTALRAVAAFRRGRGERRHLDRRADRRRGKGVLRRGRPQASRAGAGRHAGAAGGVVPHGGRNHEHHRALVLPEAGHRAG